MSDWSGIDPVRTGATRRALRALLGGLPETVRFGHAPREREYHEPVAWDAAGNDVIASVLRRGEPCLVTRLGTSEVWCLSYYRRWRRLPLWRPSYPSYSRELMTVNAGFFPGDDSALDLFARRYLDDLPEADVMGVWFNRGEQAVVRSRCPGARLVELGALNSMCYANPWSAYLEGKKVLVVHPFANSIQRQYREKRRLLFVDPTVLPEFELTTLRPVQSIALTGCGFPDWFAALDDTCDRIAEQDFDIAIIGAGAYGLPLGAFVKRMGKQAVHMGGATQILFGIRGRRWEVEYQDSIVPLFNEHWVRPLPEETPSNAAAVEAACYW